MWTFADQLGEVHVSLENYIKTKLYDPGSQILIDGVPKGNRLRQGSVFFYYPWGVEPERAAPLSEEVQWTSE